MLTTKIGHVLENHIKDLLQTNYKPVTEEEFTQRFYKTYPFLDNFQSLRYNLEYWYIYDGITLCKYDHFAELEFRNRALVSVKNRDDYESLSIFQLLDFLYLIDCLIWVDNRMVGIQIASMPHKQSYNKNFNNINKNINNLNKENEFSKYSSIRSLAKKGIHTWLDRMIVIYSNMSYLKSEFNIKGLIKSINNIANCKPLLRKHNKGFINANSIYESPFNKGHKPFLITVNDKGVLYTRYKAVSHLGQVSCNKFFKPSLYKKELINRT